MEGLFIEIWKQMGRERTVITAVTRTSVEAVVEIREETKAEEEEDKN